MPPQAIFQQRQTDFQQRADALQQQYSRLSWIRLLVFGLTALAVWWVAATDTWTAIGIAILGVIVFMILLQKHQKIAYQRNLQRALVAINKDESARLQFQFLRPETGNQYAPDAHPYAGDLDLFGTHSLFRWLNRAHTQAGMSTLAQWLLSPTDEIEIQVRQEAVTELRPLLEWRQDFEATARVEKAIAQTPDFLQEWLDAGENETVKRWRGWRWLPIVTVCAVVGAAIGLWPWIVPVLLLGFQGFILAKLNPSVQHYAEHSNEITQTLKAYGKLLESIENQNFTSSKLKQLRSQLGKGDEAASRQIQALTRYTENLNFRLNPYFMLFFGWPLLWDLQWMTRLEDWKKQHQHRLRIWLEVLGEIETLNSMSGMSYAHPTYVFADINQRPLHLTAKDLGHPLIPQEKRVCNDFELTGIGQTVVVTGSNMSGKSTFLRTVGVNVVLALMGSPVCAEAFSCSLVRVFTSMRTQDSLAENTSSFYAELKRLKTLLELAQKNTVPVLYFLDEILKGTNSTDRHKGAEALVHQLHTLTASGFVSTHDLELGAIADTHDFVRNLSFYSTFTDGQLHFDYRLREGVCREFNATALMQQIGIRFS
ncbi:MAG: DNA mismatch repair protein MutS [Spirosomaceae bacterium]|nr:DNA mismatch repair protein MutS [Spirosomataceae bacterium]